MDLRTIRQTLKALADDTRLRIINLLSNKELSVSTISEVLSVNQSTVSKHLVRLRLLKIVTDRRDGSFVYYSLNRLTPQYTLINSILKEYDDIKIFNCDLVKLK